MMFINPVSSSSGVLVSTSCQVIEDKESCQKTVHLSSGKNKTVVESKLKNGKMSYSVNGKPSTKVLAQKKIKSFTNDLKLKSNSKSAKKVTPLKKSLKNKTIRNKSRKSKA